MAKNFNKIWQILEQKKWAFSGLTKYSITNYSNRELKEKINELKEEEQRKGEMRKMFHFEARVLFQIRINLFFKSSGDTHLNFYRRVNPG